MKQSGEGDDDDDDVDDRREEKRGREHTRNYVSWVWDLLRVSFKRLLLAFHTFVYGKARTQSQTWTAVSTRFVDWKTFQNNCWEICLTSLATDREKQMERARGIAVLGNIDRRVTPHSTLLPTSLLVVPSCRHALPLGHWGVYLLRRLMTLF